MNKLSLNKINLFGYHENDKEGSYYEITVGINSNRFKKEDYNIIYHIIKKQMNKSSNTLIKLCYRILLSIKRSNNLYKCIKIKLCKLNPLLNEYIEKLCYVIKWKINK